MFCSRKEYLDGKNTWLLVAPDVDDVTKDKNVMMAALKKMYHMEKENIKDHYPYVGADVGQPVCSNAIVVLL